MALTTIPHMLRSHSISFARKYLVVDHTPASGRLSGPSHQIDADLFTQTLADTVPGSTIETLRRDPSTRRRINREWFGRSAVSDRCASGTPIYPFVFGISMADTEFVLHADCDMLFYDPGNPSWIEEGMRILGSEPDVMFVNQMMGPRSDCVPDPEFLAPYDSDRHLRLATTFSTRCFLLQRSKLLQFLPLLSTTYPVHRQVIYAAQGRSRFLPLERMVAHQLTLTNTFRCDLSSSFGFTLHAANKNWFSTDPGTVLKVIGDIEEGKVSQSQVGHINLNDTWDESL
jgi:hypothetical protein